MEFRYSLMLCPATAYQLDPYSLHLLLQTSSTAQQITLTFLKKMGQLRPLFRLFSVFPNKQDNFYNKFVKKCPSSIRCRDLNPRPSGRESLPITTRPDYPNLVWSPNLINFFCLKFDEIDIFLLLLRVFWWRALVCVLLLLAISILIKRFQKFVPLQGAAN